jgi:HEAT repeat protein
MIDSAIEDPSLAPDVIRALGAIGDDRARFYLERMLHEGGAGNREEAAVALARLGGRAMSPLRDAVRSDDRDVRLAAVRAILPVASPDDLTALYVYLTDHADDDPATSQSIRAAAAMIEEALEAREAAEGASSPRDF